VRAGWLGGLTIFAVSFGLAVLSYRFVEQPFRRKRPGQLRLRLALAGSLTGLIAFGGVAGEQTRGFTARFPEAVVRLDEDRGQWGDWRPCFGRTMADACLMGLTGVAPDAVLWGDSHALSWAPAVDAELKRAGRSALLVSTAGCAPFAGARNPINPRCDGRNAEVMDGLDANEGIRTVILTGYWSTYFRLGGPIGFPLDGRDATGLARGIEGASAALRATVERLLDGGRDVVLIGPVPAYPRSVPAAMAMEQTLGWPLLDRSLRKQQERHAPFFDALASVGEREALQVLDPLDWLCPDGECRVLEAEESLYRDGHHLNARGAQLLAPRIGAALDPRGGPPH
jgi:hypothetical protein